MSEKALNGKTGTSEYFSWHSMMSRCYDQKDSRFSSYGARGITVCERWHDIENFLVDMGERPPDRNGARPKFSLDRIDNDKGYDPDNCRWATTRQQMETRSTTKLSMVSAREIRMLYGRGYTQLELAKEFGVRQDTISRIVNHKRWKEET
jgi:hypothetical protein